MFSSKQPNPYDESVTKTTDENLTSENWELILLLCDKVNDDGEQGARNVISAVLKRLAHRNPNVQLYTLALVEALSKNCQIALHREMASRSFTQGLEKLVTDRTTHEKVKRRALHLISFWCGEFENNSQLDLMEQLYKTLKAKNYKFDQISEPPPPDVDDEARRKEEEELQRVLEMSVHDKGGRVGLWKDSGASGGAEASGSSSSRPVPSSSGGYTPTEPLRTAYAPSETHHKGVVPAKQQTLAAAITSETSEQTSSTVASARAPSPTPATSTSAAVTRVRALHTFEPTVAGELAFEKGDIIKVTDRAYDNWWRGQLRGRTGIFPVNYVEPLPDLTPSELAREAEQEASVFAQAANIDKLITMLRGLDPVKDNLADNEEIQELYRSSMALRPKIVKLIDKYSQKRAELVSMNENFVRARGVFEQMMEDSLARHTGVYDSTQPTFRTARPDSRNVGPDPHASAYAWNPMGYDQTGYNAYPAAAAYASGEQPPHPYQKQAYNDSNAYGVPQGTYGAQMQPQGSQPYPPGDAYHQSQQQPPQPQGSPSFGHTAMRPEHAQSFSPAPTNPAAYAQQTTQSQPHSQSQSQVQPTQNQGQSGPPYMYDPNTRYSDPNVQAWAQYYAQGGKDMAGTVYFVSVPGVTEVSTQNSAAPSSGPQASQTQQVQAPPAGFAAEAPVTSDQLSAQQIPAQTQSTYSVSAPESADQAQHPAQGQAAYQTYGYAPPQPTSPVADQNQHPAQMLSAQQTYGSAPPVSAEPSQHPAQAQPAYQGYGSPPPVSADPFQPPAQVQSTYQTLGSAPPSTSPPADQSQHPAQVQTAYQPYSSAPLHPTSTPADQSLQPTQGQPLHQAYGSTAQSTPANIPSSTGSVAYRRSSVRSSQQYPTGGYPGPRGPVSPSQENHPEYQHQGQSQSGLPQGQIASVAQEGVGA